MLKNWSDEDIIFEMNKTEYDNGNNVFTEKNKIILEYSEKVFDFMSNHMYNRNRHKG